MGQFVGCVRGIAEACRALDFPVVSGNVSLYNETNGRAILPTPTIGGVGLLDDFTKSATLAFKAAGEAILLIGETAGLARPVALSARRSAAARRARRRRSISRPSAAQRRFRARADRATGCVTAVHDLSDGGLAGRARRDGDGVGHRRAARRARPRYAAACLLVRRGSGALCRHRRRGDVAEAVIGARARRRRPGAAARPAPAAMH